ncbi:protein trichome birefringence-like 2 [Hibiscus syriacus]|nr:protein trichome birefringence-like 2 [Hibiscus syriacus]
MDVMKHGLSEILSPGGKVVSRLVWGLVASLVVLTALLLNSLKGPIIVGSFFQGSYSPNNTTAVSLRSSVAEAPQQLPVVEGPQQTPVADGPQQTPVADGPQQGPVGTEKKIEPDASNVTEKQDILKQIEDNRPFLGNPRLGNLSEAANNGTLVGGNANANNEGNSSSKEEVIGEDKAMELNDPRHNDTFKTCDFFDGKWVRNDRWMPYYRPGSCPFIDKDFDCQRNGRPDDGYIKWRWQPNGCDIPRLNATDFLEKLRGKRLVYIGDSLNRNMWESMVCILRHSVKKKKRVYEISGRTDFKKRGVFAFRFEDYNCSVDFVSAPFLVRESYFKRENGSIETLRLDLMDPATSTYHDADLLVFNTGHWWTHDKTSKGEDYYQEGDHVYQRLKVLKAYQKALTTWSRWVDSNVDSSRTQVFFRGYSVAHFWGGQWNSGGNCHQETEPITNETYLTNYPSKMRALEHVLQQTKTPVIYFNVSRLTDYRKDAHPSIYRSEYKTEEERNRAVAVQDCSHWCLPGVPDTWNELLYASLLKAGKGIWGN